MMMSPGRGEAEAVEPTAGRAASSATDGAPDAEGEIGVHPEALRRPAPVTLLALLDAAAGCGLLAGAAWCGLRSGLVFFALLPALGGLGRHPLGWTRSDSGSILPLHFSALESVLGSPGR